MTQVLKTPISFSSTLPKTGVTSSTNAASARSIKLYEAKPPSNLPSELIDAESVLATTKEEEWVTKKKTELTTKKQIETRVKRQVVLEDGKVVEDSGPIVTTNTTEDTEKQEHQQTEHRNVGDDEPSASEGWIAVPDSAATGLVSKQVKENKLKSREETEERLETEHVQHLGDITDDAFLKAIQSQRNDLRLALRQASSELLNTSSTMPTPAPSNGRVVHHSLKNRKTVDTEDTKHLSQVQNDGRLITETTTITEHEEVKNTAEPDDDDDDGDQNNADEDYETHEKSSQRYRKSKEQELIEYVADGVKIGQQVRYEAENVEGDRHGNADGLKMQPLEWESLSERVRRMRKEKQLKLQEADRMDALTRKPLNVDQEEQTRKSETSKWLEHHFGSESRSSKSSLDSDNEDEKDDDGGGGGSGRRAKRSTSFINVTMKSTKPARTQSQSPTASVPTTGTNSYKRVSNIGNDMKSTSSATKNVYEIQTGNVKKIQADERPFLPSLFRPIDEQRQTKTPPPTTTFYTAQSASSSAGVSAYNSKSESYPLYASVQRKYPSSSSSSSSIATATANKLSTTKNFGHSPTRLASSQSDQRKNFEATIQIEANRSRNQNREAEKKLTSAGRDTSTSNLSNSWSRSERRLADIDDSRVHNEPDPDYTPRLRKKVLSTPDMRVSSPPPPPPIDATKKKIYQKTRFAADMPLVKRSKSTSRPERKSISGGGVGGAGSSGTSGGFGQTFRKIISRFHNKEGVEKKGKKWRNESSSSPPPPPISKNHDDDGGGGGGYYQTFGNVDNHIADTSGSNANSNVGEMENGGRESPLPKQAAKHFSSEQLNNANVVSKKRVTTPSPSPSPFFRRSSALTSANANPNPNASSSLWYSQTLDRNYRSNSSKNINTNTNTTRDKQLDEMFKRRSPVQKYYLGEDPFRGSIYGREKEYDAAAAKPFRKKQHKNSNGNANANGQEKKSVKSHILNGMHNIFGGRLGRSTSKLGSDSNQKSTNKKSQYIDYTNRGGIQTLPRKSKKQVFINDPSSDQENLHSRRSLNRNASSLINVSVINDGGGGGRSASTFKLSPDIVGPEKPARTYRTSLLRSKSFNVQLGPYGYERSRSPVLAFKSNPQLHKLEESQAPLKSPGIVTSISRSTRDLSKSADDHDRHHHHYFEQRTAAKDYSKINGFSSSPSPSSYDNSSSRRLFLKGLKSRAPELYKTLHEDDESDSPLPSSHAHTTSSMIRNGGGIGRPKQRLLEYSNSFHSGTLPSSRKPTVSFESDRQHSPVTASRSLVTSAVDSNNSDDYNETVRITSKSNDPIRPSVTNTVQSFSKKTIPSKDGRLETIESSETTRVTKSHYRAGDSDTEKNATNTSSSNRYNTKNGKNSKNGSVVIEVRNDRN